MVIKSLKQFFESFSNDFLSGLDIGLLEVGGILKWYCKTIIVTSLSRLFTIVYERKEDFIRYIGFSRNVPAIRL
jgi:hypothetical protein